MSGTEKSPSIEAEVLPCPKVPIVCFVFLLAVYFWFLFTTSLLLCSEWLGLGFFFWERFLVRLRIGFFTWSQWLLSPQGGVSRWKGEETTFFGWQVRREQNQDTNRRYSITKERFVGRWRMKYKWSKNEFRRLLNTKNVGWNGWCNLSINRKASYVPPTDATY